MLTEKQKGKIKNLVVINYNNQGQLKIIGLYESCAVEATDYYKTEMFRYCASKIFPERVAILLGEIWKGGESMKSFIKEIMEKMEIMEIAANLLISSGKIKIKMESV